MNYFFKKTNEDIKLNKFIKDRLNMEPSLFYEQNGGSPRAVLSRGLLMEIVRQYKAYPSFLIDVIFEFRGVSTEISWFVEVPLLIVMFPILPILKAKIEVSKAINFYKFDYLEGCEK